MARLPEQRSSNLTPEEIAAEALRQFDSGSEPSIRSLAAALEVAPSAIYHHFSSRSDIVDAALGLVWKEAMDEGMKLIGDDLADPRRVLIVAAMATRRAFGRHHLIAPQLAATPQAEKQLAANLNLLAGAFEQLGLSEEAAAEAFHTYGSFSIGSTLVLATRLTIAEKSGAPQPKAVTSPPEKRTQHALEQMMILSNIDPERDEELFVNGLSRLIDSFVEDPGGRR